MKLKKISAILMTLLVLTLVFAMSASVFTIGTSAEETTQEATEEPVDNTSGSKALAAGIAVGLASAAGAIAMGWAVAKSSEAVARQPEASDKIRSGMMLGLVFVETAIIYALIVAILIIFVL